MLISASSLHEYFRAALMVAIKQNSYQVTENAQAYLVYLLSDFGRSENVWAGVNYGEKPVFALLLSRAQEADPEEALRTYKHVGDSTLYCSGFFPEFLSGQSMNLSYYQSIGESAYLSAARLTSAPIYHELASSFNQLVDILRFISLHGDAGSEKEPSSEQLFEWLERYKRTNDPELLDLLVKYGVFRASAA